MIKRFLTWFKGFFEQDSKQSMTRLLALLIGISGAVYLFITKDYLGACAIWGLAGTVKIAGKKLTEK